MDLEERGCGDVDWIYQAWDVVQVAGSFKHGNEPSGFIKGMAFIDKLNN
jgi:hypothetical protein